MNPQVAIWLKYTSPLAALALAQWIVVYSFLEPWWKSRIGRSLVGNAALAMITPVLFVLALWFNISRFTSESLGWVEAGTFIGITLLLSWRTVIWVGASRREREPDAEQQE